MIINNTPNDICRGTDLPTDSNIFSQYSGISSHSFGRLYYMSVVYSCQKKKLTDKQTDIQHNSRNTVTTTTTAAGNKTNKKIF
jgi:hypothetical protein